LPVAALSQRERERERERERQRDRQKNLLLKKVNYTKISFMIFALGAVSIKLLTKVRVP